MLRRLSTLLLLAALLALAACKGGMPHKKVDMIGGYGIAVRWSDWDNAWMFVDPASGGGGALPDSERLRLKDLKVTGYTVVTRVVQPDGTQRQVVEIRYVREATQIEKVTRDTQTWRTNDEGEHWLLTSGLPEF